MTAVWPQGAPAGPRLTTRARTPTRDQPATCSAGSGWPGRTARASRTAWPAGPASALRQVTADQDGVRRLAALVSFRSFTEAGAHDQRVPPQLGPLPGPGGRGDDGGLTRGLVASCAQEVALRHARAGSAAAG